MTRDEAISILQAFGEGIDPDRRLSDGHVDFHHALATITGIPADTTTGGSEAHRAHHNASPATANTQPHSSSPSPAPRQADDHTLHRPRRHATRRPMLDHPMTRTNTDAPPSPHDRDTTSSLVDQINNTQTHAITQSDHRELNQCDAQHMPDRTPRVFRGASQQDCSPLASPPPVVEAPVGGRFGLFVSIDSPISALVIC